MKKLFLLITLVTLLTQNTHTQWVQQTVPVSKPITGIKFIDTNTGWACTSIGTSGLNYAYILHTTNGGTNWSVQDSSFNSDYNALSVVDANVIYAGGDSVGFGKLAKTTNGGANWAYLQLPINMLIGDMQFLNKDSGWSCSGVVGPDVRTTTNGGLNWTVRTNGISSQTQRIFFLNYSTGFCGANDNVLYKTTNAGLNWLPFYNAPDLVYSIFFMNEVTGWVGLNNNMIHFTSNSGINWVNQQVPLINSQPVLDIYFVDNMTGWAGRNTNIYLTTNGGANWGYQLISTGTKRISFINSSTGWGGNFGISKTTNNGGSIFYSGLQGNGTEIPKEFKLYQNYPNPFNPTTTINFDINHSGNVRLIIFDILGKTIKELLNENLISGTYKYTFEAEDLPSGTYFYRLITDKYNDTKKMILVK